MTTIMIVVGITVGWLAARQAEDHRNRGRAEVLERVLRAMKARGSTTAARLAASTLRSLDIKNMEVEKWIAEVEEAHCTLLCRALRKAVSEARRGATEREAMDAGFQAYEGTIEN